MLMLTLNISGVTSNKSTVFGAPKTVDLLEVTPEMFKVSISISDRKKIKGWIPRDNRIWGDDPKEIQQDYGL